MILMRSKKGKQNAQKGLRIDNAETASIRTDKVMLLPLDSENRPTLMSNTDVCAITTDSLANSLKIGVAT